MTLIITSDACCARNNSLSTTDILHKASKEQRIKLKFGSPLQMALTAPLLKYLCQFQVTRKKSLFPRIIVLVHLAFLILFLFSSYNLYTSYSYCVSGHYPSSCFLFKTHNVSETGFCLHPQAKAYSVGPNR
jgi:hypothetical protein